MSYDLICCGPDRYSESWLSESLYPAFLALSILRRNYAENEKSLQSELHCPDGRLQTLILPVVNSTSVSHISYFKNSIYFFFCQPYFHNFNIQQCCSHSHASHSNMLSKQSSLSIFPVVFLPMKCQSHTHLLSPISGVMIPDHHSRDQTAADTDTCHRHPTENTDGKPNGKNAARSRSPGKRSDTGLPETVPEARTVPAPAVPRTIPQWLFHLSVAVKTGRHVRKPELPESQVCSIIRQ